MGVGTSAQMFGLTLNLYSDVNCNIYGTDIQFSPRPTTDSYLARLVWTHDGATMRAYWRGLQLDGALAGRWAEGSASQTGLTLATNDAGPVVLGDRAGYFPSNNGAGLQVAGIGVLGGIAWTPEEAWDWVRHPERLWRRSGPIALSGLLTQAWVEAILEAVAASDTLAPVLGALATAGDGVVAVDAAPGVLAAGLTAMEAATPADVTIPIAAANVAAGDAIGPGDALGAMAAAGANVADAMLPADALVPVLSISVGVAGAATPVDGTAVTLSSATVLGEAIAPADGLTIQLGAILAATISIAPSDAISAAQAIQDAIAEAIAPADAASIALDAIATAEDGIALDFTVAVAERVITLRIHASHALRPAGSLRLIARPRLNTRLTLS